MHTRDQLDKYAAVHFLGTEPLQEGIAYTYASRLRRLGDDQISRVVQVLKAEPDQRRAVAVTWDVGENGEDRVWDSQMRTHLADSRPSDAAAKNPPCLVMLWFRRDADGSLYTHATFRSHDLLRAGVPNAWGLARLAEHVAGQLDWPVGRLTVCSLSGHVYSDGWQAAEAIAKARGRAAVYEEDDRAILRVRRADDRLAVDLLLPDGSVAATLEGATAEGVEREVLEAGWISTLSHAAWVGRMLAQAAAERAP